MPAEGVVCYWEGGGNALGKPCNSWRNRPATMQFWRYSLRLKYREKAW